MRDAREMHNGVKTDLTLLLNNSHDYEICLYFFVKTSISKMRRYRHISMLFERWITTKKSQWEKNQRLGVEIEVDFYTWLSPY